MRASRLREHPVIRLQPWGRLEGMALDGTRPWRGLSLTLAVPEAAGRYFFDSSSVPCVTDEQGRFILEDVPPGEWFLAALFPSGPNASALSHYQRVFVPAGGTAHVQFGGVGRPVVGRVVCDEPGQIPDYSVGRFSLGRFEARPPAHLSPEAMKAWIEQHQPTRIGRPYQVVVKPDGSFRISNVPPGEYELDMVFLKPTMPQPMYGFGEELGRLQRRVSVPPVPAEVSDAPVDLGVLSVEVFHPLVRGAVAPDFAVKTLDSQRFRLSEQRGKFVLIHFWATWCGPCLVELQHLREVWKQFGGKPEFTMIGLSLDRVAGPLQAVLQEEQIAWPQARLGKKSETDLRKLYHVRGVPAMFLVGPDGRIVCAGIRGPGIRDQIEVALRR